MKLTNQSLETFLVYAKDAGNWSGTPWVSGGNVTCTREMRGNLSDLVQKGLIEIVTEWGTTFINFTDTGVELAKSHQIDIYKADKAVA